MSQNKQDKQAMKALREERKAFIKSASVNMKRQKKAVTLILEQLKEGAQTVPAIAAATGAAAAETLWYLAALKKYGQIKEAAKDGGYYTYELANAEAADLSE